MKSRLMRWGSLAVTAVLGLIAVPQQLQAQDELWEHQQRVNAQQAEERRLWELADMQAHDAEEEEDYYEEDTSPPFVSYPPEAWADWVAHGQEMSRKAEQERIDSDPVYRALAQGTWTYLQSDPKKPVKACEATFWTRNGGVSFIHFGGTNEFTLLGFFGAAIPSVKKPRVVELELIQSGETQKVRAINTFFGPVRSMGMVLFNVHTPQILIGAIEDKQDFEIRLNGESIAKGEWHSGLQARDQLASCLRGQGYLPAAS